MDKLSCGAAICYLVPLALAALSQGFGRSQAALGISQSQDTDLVRFTTAHGGHHKLEIDDADGFVTPVVARDFEGAELELRANDAGLIAGIVYHLRLDGKREAEDLRLPLPAQLDARADCATLRHTWEATGRADVGEALSGLKWEGDRWEIAPHTYLLGESLYNSEMAMRPALEAARVCGDIRTLDEMAQYYIVMLRQTETVGDLLKRPRVTVETKNRLSATDHAARTFATAFGQEAGERELFNAQWLHPAAELLRAVTVLPEKTRTPAMRNFASLYTQFIVKDQLERYLFYERLSPLGGIGIEGRVAGWEAAIGAMNGKGKWDTAMSDIDLWLLASVAEALGANANDPQLAKIDERSLKRLRAAMATGIRFFQLKRASYPETKDFKGESVGSASYFNGDYPNVSDNEFSAVGGEKLPATWQKRANPDVSWDISHIYRLPIFLRALYENRKALGSEFPSYKDVQLVANQYVYRVFDGDWSRPLFRNFFDGSDGWFRIGYNGDGFGYPPSEFCDMRNPKRPCLFPGEIMGWSELAFANADLARLEASLVGLAFAENPAIAEFRERHFSWNGAYKVNVVKGLDIYGGALYSAVAENAAMIAARNLSQP